MKPKLLIFLLVLLLILLFVSLGMAGSSASSRWFAGGLDLENAQWSRTMGDWLTQPLPPDEIINLWPGTCRPRESTFIVGPETTCTATILGSNTATRQLKLQLVQGKAVTVVLEQENALTVEVRLEHATNTDATPTPLDIYKNADLHNATLRFHSCEVQRETTTPEATEDEPEEAEKAASPQPPPTCVLEVT